MTLIESLPTFTKSATLEQFRAAFDSVQCVCFKQVDSININRAAAAIHAAADTSKGKKRKRKQRTRKHKKERSSDAIGRESSDDRSSKALSFQQAILSTFKSATCKDQDSWTVENDAGVLESSTSASDFLSSSATQNGYCSFVLQDDSNKTLSNFTEQHVRHPSLPLSAQDESQKQQIADTVCMADPYWLFVGRNSNSHGMKGRNEHTDDIDHNGGTFHYQVAGTKIWTLRPTDELRAMCDELDVALKGSYVHTVEEGDIFVINTRLWWHQTEIPGTCGGDNNRGVGSGCNLSISYARDIYLDGTQPTEGIGCHMSSKDGSWATAFIPKGAVLLTDADPPISRTSKRGDANCELVIVGENEDGEDQLALVTLRDIKEGEFYMILEVENAVKKRRLM